MTKTLTLIQPDDWHIHLRDGEALATTVRHAAASFNRVICMPNLVPPVKTANQAIAYRERILKALKTVIYRPLAKIVSIHAWCFYLTDQTTAKDIDDAAQTGIVSAVKLYPAGATTNSADGVTDILARSLVFEAMQSMAYRYWCMVKLPIATLISLIVKNDFWMMC